MKKIIITLLLFLMAQMVCEANEPKTSEDDNAIISLVLHRSYEDGRFTVVQPETQFSHVDFSDQERTEQTKAYIKENIHIDGYDIDPLVDKLFDKNRKSVRLTLKSDPSRGYLIDYEGKYDHYFEKGGGGWEKWYEENPKAHGSTTISLPAQDKDKHIVLIYIGTQSHWLAGAGFVIAYRYEEGKLQEVSRVMLWIS